MAATCGKTAKSLSWRHLLWLGGLVPCTTLQAKTTPPVVLAAQPTVAPLAPRFEKIYQKALAKFKKRKYYAASEYFDDLLPYVRGKAQGITVLYYRACCAYEQKNYEEAAPLFEQLYRTYPATTYTEEAYYKRAFALYRSAPPIKLDPMRVESALQALDTYLSKFPDGSYHATVQAAHDQMEEQLAKQTLYIANTYYKLEHYKAALHTLADFERLFPANAAQPMADYWRARIAYQQFKQTGKKAAFAGALNDYCEVFLNRHTENTYKKQIKHVTDYQRKALAALEKLANAE